MKADAQPVRARRERLRKAQRRGLGGGIERDLGALRLVVDGGGLESHVDRIEGEPRGRLAHLDVDDLDPGEREALKIGREFDRIVDGNNRLRQLARRGVEGKAGSASALADIDKTSAMIAVSAAAKLRIVGGVSIALGVKARRCGGWGSSVSAC